MTKKKTQYELNASAAKRLALRDKEHYEKQLYSVKNSRVLRFDKLTKEIWIKNYEINIANQEQYILQIEQDLIERNEL